MSPHVFVSLENDSSSSDDDLIISFCVIFVHLSETIVIKSMKSGIESFQSREISQELGITRENIKKDGNDLEIFHVRWQLLWKSSQKWGSLGKISQKMGITWDRGHHNDQVCRGHGSEVDCPQGNHDEQPRLRFPCQDKQLSHLFQLLPSILNNI